MSEHASPSGPRQGEAVETRLRVLTWNLWWRYGPWEQRRSAITETLRGLEWDIAALQEVWDVEDANLAAELADALDCHFTYESAEMREGIGFGNAILSRWPLSQRESRPLFGERETDEERGAVFAEVDGPRGALQVFSTHLNWKFEHSHIRQRQVSDLALFVSSKRTEDYPPIVGGDFNAVPTSDEIRMMTGETTCPVEGLVFHDAWRAAGEEGPGYTWDSANPYAAMRFEPNARIDYLFVGPPAEAGRGQVVDCRLIGTEPVDGVWPSDHFGLLAELRY